MAWRRPGDKPLSKPMVVSLLTHIWVTRPQCVKKICGRNFKSIPSSEISPIRILSANSVPNSPNIIEILGADAMVPIYSHIICNQHIDQLQPTADHYSQPTHIMPGPQFTLQCRHNERDGLSNHQHMWDFFTLRPGEVPVGIFRLCCSRGHIRLRASMAWNGCTLMVWSNKYSISQEICTRFCFSVLCCGYTLTDFPISIRLTSLALWQCNDCPSASKATLMNMDKYFMWIRYERLHNHNKAKHNKTVCIFLGIYCSRTPQAPRAMPIRAPWVDVRFLFKTPCKQPGKSPYEAREYNVTGA